MVPDPNLAILLIACGTLAIYAELCRPGRVVPGVLGGIAFVVGLASLHRGERPPDWPFALMVLVPLAALTVFLLKIAVRARRNKRSA